MPFIDKIVSFINQSLKESSLNDKRFQPSKLIGITTVLARPSDNGFEMLPAECDLNGNYSTVEPNDKFNIIIYHKVISNNYIREKKAYGDIYVFRAQTEMQLAVIADSRKVKLSAEQIEPLIVYGLPLRLSDAIMQETGFASSLITPLSSNMDKVMVFRQEYPSTKYFLKPFHHFFSVRYRIETVFDKNCIDRCQCDS
jgi:hypothetical protein